jgi:hypothetical protein
MLSYAIGLILLRVHTGLVMPDMEIANIL